jgi:hypothetical protein
MQFYFAESSRILTKTMPYLLLRIAIYCLISLATAVYLGLVILISKVFGSGGAVVFLIGLAVLVGLLRLLKQYVLYLINAGHIAVITELIEKEALPDNINQFQYGKTIVTNMFKDISVLFVVDRMVDGIIRTFNRTVASVADLLPVPGMEGLTRVVNAVIGFSLTFIDETILSYNLARKDENIWESAKRGIILYAQNWRPILTTAAASAAANFVGFIVLFLVLLVPFVPLALMTHSDALKFFWLALAFTLAYGLKLSVFNPFFQVSMILTFRSATAGQQPDPQWEARLEMASDKFLQLKEKALDFVQARSPSH